MYHSQLYQKKIARAYNKKIMPGKIKEGDLVLKLTRPIMADSREKFKLNWEGPYLAKKLFSKGAAILSDLYCMREVIMHEVTLTSLFVREVNFSCFVGILKSDFNH